MAISNCKYCPKCEEVKTLDKFHKNAKKSQGVHAICKACKKAYDRARSHLYNKTDLKIVKCKTCDGNTRSDRKSGVCRLCELGPPLPKHFHEFQMEQNRIKREGRDSYGVKSRYRTLKRRSADKGFDDCLDFDIYENLIKQDCVYCGEENIGSGVGLDRLDNEIGYLEHNVVSCCSCCNQIRGHNLTVMEI